MPVQNGSAIYITDGEYGAIMRAMPERFWLPGVEDNVRRLWFQNFFGPNHHVIIGASPGYPIMGQLNSNPQWGGHDCWSPLSQWRHRFWGNQDPLGRFFPRDFRPEVGIDRFSLPYEWGNRTGSAAHNQPYFHWTYRLQVAHPSWLFIAREPLIDPLNTTFIDLGTGLRRTGDPRRYLRESQNVTARFQAHLANRHGGVSVRFLAQLALLMAAGYLIWDWLDSLPDDEELAAFNAFIDCTDGGVCPRVGPATYDDWRVFINDVFNPDPRDPSVNDDCETAFEIQLGVQIQSTVNAASNDDNPAERWYVHTPNDNVFTGSGPWTCSVTLTSPGVLPTVQVRNGYCFGGNASNLNAPVIDTATQGCHEFQVTTKQPIFIRVVTEAGGISQANVTLSYAPCLTDPGENCSGAPTIANGQTYGPFVCGPSPEEHWFRLPANTRYRVTLTGITASGTNQITLWHGVCGNLTEIIIYECDAPTVPNDQIATGDATQVFQGSYFGSDARYLVIGALSEGSVTYSVKVEAEACP